MNETRTEQTAEVIVVGLGAMGSCALAALARRGVRALGIDRFNPPHARGSSHGGSRVIRLSYFEHPDYVPLLREAYEGFDRLSCDAGVTLRHETGLVVGGAPGNATSAGMLRSAREHGLDVAAIDGRALRRRYPQFSVPDDWEVVTEARGGFVRPEATIAAALEFAARQGARIVRDTVVVRWGSRDGGAWVQTAAGRVECAALILAGGAWMPELLDASVAALRPTRETLVWIDDSHDAAWQSNAMPVWLFDRGIEPAVYGIPAFTGMGAPAGMKVGLHGRGPTVRPEQIEEPVDPAVVAETVAATEERVPSARGRRVSGAAHCLYTMSPDTDFVVGLHPAHDRVAIAGGFSGHGFKFAPVMGEVLADLAQHGRTSRPIGFLRPTRFEDGRRGGDIDGGHR
jgi:sarcosine oxidase